MNRGVWKRLQAYMQSRKRHLIASANLHLLPHKPPHIHAHRYGVPPVDFVPAAESNTYETAVQRAEQFIIDRFVKAMPHSVRAPVVHIIKVRGLWWWVPSGWVWVGRKKTPLSDRQ